MSGVFCDLNFVGFKFSGVGNKFIEGVGGGGLDLLKLLISKKKNVVMFNFVKVFFFFFYGFDYLWYFCYK